MTLAPLIEEDGDWHSGVKEEQVTKLRDEITFKGKIRITKHDIITDKITVNYYDNIVTTAGRNAICRRMANAGSYVNEGVITYVAVGTNTSIPVAGDIQLGAELYRKVPTSILASTNVLSISIYFGTTEAIGSLREFGLFGEAASAAANSGTLFDRASINETKTGTNTLTIDATLTLA